MMDTDTIIATYERIEFAHGGVAGIAADEVVELTARELGISSHEVHDVMVAEWRMAGSG